MQNIEWRISNLEDRRWVGDTWKFVIQHSEFDIRYRHFTPLKRLAFWTKIGAASDQHNPFDRRAATQTRFAFAIVHTEFLLKIARITAAVNKIIEGGAAHLDGLSQHRLHLFQQMLPVSFDELIRCGERMNACLIERFVRNTRMNGEPAA